MTTCIYTFDGKILYKSIRINPTIFPLYIESAIYIETSYIKVL
jgi:hypothetical protein